MGGWIVKFVVFIVVLLALRGAPWLNNTVFFVALVASVVVSLVIDVLVMLRMRVPVVDTPLPTLADVSEEADLPEEGEGPSADKNASRD